MSSSEGIAAAAGEAAIRRLQALLSTVLVLAVLGTGALIDGIGRSAWLQDWIDAQRDRHAETDNTPEFHEGIFTHVGSQILLEEVPAADYPRGGVVFVGSSALRSAVQVWHLPADQRSLVHNLAFPAATQLDQKALLDYLMEYHGLGTSPPDTTLVVFVLFYGNTATAGEGYLGRLFPEHLRWTQLFDYEDFVLRPKPTWALERFLTEQRLRCAELLRLLTKDLTIEDGALTLAAGLPPRGPHDVEERRRTWQRLMDGENQMRRQTAALGEAIASLRSRGVAVQLVMQPIASWHRRLPHSGAYARLVGNLATRHGLEILDLTKSFADDDYYDATHLDFRASRRLHEELMVIARQHLEVNGLLR